MKKSFFLLAILFLFNVGLLTGCDPSYPPGKLRVTNIDFFSQGDSVDIEILYPDTGGTFTLGWKEQNIEILSGQEVIAVSDLTIIGLKPGIAVIKVSATTVISEEAAKSGYEERVYSTEIEIKVE